MLFWFGLVLCHFYRQDCQHFAAFLSWTYSVHNLGVLLDSNLTMVPHVNSVTKTCFYYLALISRICTFLDRESTKSLVHALVISRLDYANSLLYGLPNSVLKKLQRVQNSAVRLIFGAGSRDHITPLRRELHWLPIDKRLDFKIAL